MEQLFFRLILYIVLLMLVLYIGRIILLLCLGLGVTVGGGIGIFKTVSAYFSAFDRRCREVKKGSR